MRFLNKGASSVQIAPWWISQPRNQNQSTGDSIVTTRSKVFCNVKWGSFAAIKCRKEVILQKKYQLDKQDVDFGLFCDSLTRQRLKLNWCSFDSSIINRSVVFCKLYLILLESFEESSLGVLTICMYIYICICIYLYIYGGVAVHRGPYCEYPKSDDDIIFCRSLFAYTFIYPNMCWYIYIYTQIYMCTHMYVGIHIQIQICTTMYSQSHLGWHFRKLKA